jgi:hypothetical protein
MIGKALGCLGMEQAKPFGILAEVWGVGVVVG